MNDTSMAAPSMPMGESGPLNHTVVLLPSCPIKRT